MTITKLSLQHTTIATMNVSSSLSATTNCDPSVMEAIDRGNAVVFLDIMIGEGTQAVELGRIKLELFVNDVSIINYVDCFLDVN
jgi:hypothetical protein